MRLVDCFLEILGYANYLTRKPGDRQPEVETVKQDLSGLLDQSARRAKTGGFSDSEYDQARFGVCAFVDEAILCSTWDKRDQWQAESLQRRIYRTTNAGQEFYDRLALLEPGQKDVREVYCLCLAMGFVGAYYHPDRQEALEEIKQTNLTLFWEADEDGLLGQALFPGAYPSGSSKHRRFRWGLPSVVTGVLFLLPPLIIFGLFNYYSVVLTQLIEQFFG